MKPQRLSRQIILGHAISRKSVLIKIPGNFRGVTNYRIRLTWAIENNTWMIEDDYDSEFHFYNKPIAAMQGLLDNPPVLYLGSFSKTMMPSVRIGYLVVPEYLVALVIWSYLNIWWTISWR
ncbi:MAG: hypothetical protein P8Y45_02185 [Exilibacterium sp.]